MRTVVLVVPADESEIAADRLWTSGAQAVEERTTTDGRVELHTVLAADDQVSRARLGDLPPTWELGFVDADAAPAQTWRKHARPVAIDDTLTIHPAWHPIERQHGVSYVAIEPGASFGLGDHPTTKLTAAAAHRLVSPGDRVLDVGCGSGVLAVIAALSGASHIEAIDISEAAREATAENAELNAVRHLVSASTTPLAEIEGDYDIVLANILAPTLVSLSPDLVRVTSDVGRLVISGVLADRHRHVIDALAPMQVVATHELDGWAAVQLRHR